MKFKKYITALTALALFSSCNKEALDISTNTTENITNKTIIRVNQNTNGDFSKLNFQAGGTAGTGDLNVIMKWDIGDNFSVFNSTDGTWVCDFTMVDTYSSELAAFESDYALASGEYIAVYPATTASTLAQVNSSNHGTILSKKGNDLQHLESVCHMSTSFKFNVDQIVSLTFKNLKSLLVVNGAITNKEYNKLVVKDGSKTYTVNLDGIASEYVPEVEFLVDPVEGSRTMNIEFFNDNQSVYSEEKTVEADFVASEIYYYSGPVSDLVWDGTLANVTKGNGTSSEPWLIENPSQLAGITQDGYYTISSGGANFDLNNIEWTPIGSVKVVLDGSNVVIKNLQITKCDQLHTGLFSSIKDWSTIKNITLLASEVSSTNSGKSGGVGSLVGKAGLNCHLTNCHILNSSVSHMGGSTSYAGGVIGFASYNNFYINGCSVQNTTIECSNNTGGILGYCYGVVKITGSYCVNNTLSGAPCGGIAGTIGTHSQGKTNTDMQFIGCFVEGGTIGNEESSGSIGGILGLGYAKYYGCYTNITMPSSRVGAISGKQYEVIDEPKGGQVIALNEVMYGTYTTSTNPIINSAAIVWWNASNKLIWNGTPSQSSITVNCNYTNDFTGAEGNAINVAAVTETELADMNKAINYGLNTNRNTKNTDVKSASYKKAPDGHPLPYIVEIEYQ